MVDEFATIKARAKKKKKLEQYIVEDKDSIVFLSILNERTNAKYRSR